MAGEEVAPEDVAVCDDRAPSEDEVRTPRRAPLERASSGSAMSNGPPSGEEADDDGVDAAMMTMEAFEAMEVRTDVSSAQSPSASSSESGEEGDDRAPGSAPGSAYKRARAPTTARDLHGFKLRTDQVEPYRRFEPMLRAEEREIRERWRLFARANSPRDAGGSGDGDDDDDGGAPLDVPSLAESVRHVIRGDDEDSFLELRMLVQSGLPSDARGSLWCVFLEEGGGYASRRGNGVGRPGADDPDARARLYASLSSSDYVCARDGEGAGGAASPSPSHGAEDPSAAFAKLIDKDIPRTLPGHARAAHFIATGALRRLLIAYCRHHPHVGYCQGMNFVAGLLLLILEANISQTQTEPGAENKHPGAAENHTPRTPRREQGEEGEKGEGGGGEGSDLRLESAAFWCLDAICDRILGAYYGEDMVDLQVRRDATWHLAILPIRPPHKHRTDHRRAMRLTHPFPLPFPLPFPFPVLSAPMIAGRSIGDAGASRE